MPNVKTMMVDNTERSRSGMVITVSHYLSINSLRGNQGHMNLNCPKVMNSLTSAADISCKETTDTSPSLQKRTLSSAGLLRILETVPIEKDSFTCWLIKSVTIEKEPFICWLIKSITIEKDPFS